MPGKNIDSKVQSKIQSKIQSSDEKEEKSHIEETPVVQPKENLIPNSKLEVAPDKDVKSIDSSTSVPELSSGYSESEESDSELEEEVIETSPKKKLWVVLDLDETLLHAVPTKELHEKFSTRGEKAVLAEYVKSLNVHDMKDTDETGKTNSFYIVFERPGLQEFLDYLFEKFNVLVWTAATKDYAAFIVDKILIQSKPRKLHYLFVNHHGKKSAKKYGKKHRKRLEMLVDFYKIPGLAKNGNAGKDVVPVIVDDHDDVYSSQPDMCVAAPPWTLFNDRMDLSHEMIKDEFLKGLEKGLDQYLLESEDSVQNNPARIITRGMKNVLTNQT